MSARSRTLPAALALLALWGCRGPASGEPAAASASFESAWTFLEQPDVFELERALVPLLSESGGATDAERFWAAWTLAQGRALAALGSGSGLEPGHVRASHEVAALYYSAVATAHAEGATRAARPRLPAALAGSAPADAALGLELISVGLFGRLGFTERVARVCQRHAFFLDPSAAAAVLERGSIDPRLHGGVWLVLFEEQEYVDPRAALSFAARGLIASDRAPGALTPAQIQRLEAYIRDGSGMVFRCPACRQGAVPELRSCPNDHTSLELFFADSRKTEP